MPEPPARVPFRDPSFGTCLVRVTDRTTDLSPDDPSVGLKNEYARVQSFNADGSRVLVRGIEGTWYLYDAETLQPLEELPLVAEPRWDAANPDLVYFSDETCLMAYDVGTGDETLVHEFANDFPVVIDAQQELVVCQSLNADANSGESVTHHCGDLGELLFVHELCFPCGLQIHETKVAVLPTMFVGMQATKIAPYGVVIVIGHEDGLFLGGRGNEFGMRHVTSLVEDVTRFRRFMVGAVDGARIGDRDARPTQLLGDGYFFKGAVIAALPDSVESRVVN